jgi:uncharacterized repeat protein (TIGR01451 family)
LASEVDGDGPDPNPRASAAALTPDPALRALVRGAIPAGGVLLVPESTNQRVLALNPATGDVIDPNFVPADATNLSTPVNAQLSPDGTLVLVSDQLDDVIQAFDVTTGAFVRTFAPAGGVNLGIADNIRGWTYAANGNLLVTVGSGTNANAIAQFSPTGAALANFIAPSVGGIASPFDVFRIPSTSGPLTAGQYLISNSSNGQVNRFNADGTSVGLFATAGTFAQQITQAPNGNILVAAFSPPAGEGVFEFTPAGVQVARLDNATTSGYRGVYVLANGNVLTTTGAGIHELDRSTGALVRTIVPAVSGRYIEFVSAGAGPQPADLALTAVLSGPILVDQPATLALTLRNLGPGAAPNARVTVTLPAGASWVSDTCATTGTATLRTWAAGDLANLAQVPCTMTLRFASAGTFAIALAAQSDATDPTPGNSTFSVNASVAAPATPVPTLSLFGLVLLVLTLAAVATARLRH